MYPVIKRCIDVVAAGLGLLVLSPILAVVAIAIWWEMERPVIFKQIRPGLNGQPFFIYKYRTMTDERDDSGLLLPDDKRLTKLGKFLRSTSLDEFPELLNVLMGDMSLVGPRPLLMQYLERYTPEQARRHDVKPGITGWAQINGRNAISWEEKFALDVWYVDNYSLWLDVKILAITIGKVFQREGISAQGVATMPEFMGNYTQELYSVQQGVLQAAAAEDNNR
ncbi:MAG: sugar transferase [Syntrophomonadaceae bacterium]|nr:sugar transferase [Syntrophomonadaceae bacterium]